MAKPRTAFASYMMDRAQDLNDFVAAPERRYLVANRFAALCASDTVCGTISWGAHQVADIEQINSAMDAFTDQRRPPQRILADAQLVTTTSPLTYRAIVQYLVSRRERLRRGIAQWAIVRPRDFPGAVVTGICATIPMPYPVRVFDDLDEASDWLGISADDDFLVLARQLRERAFPDPLLTRLRLLLCEQIGIDLARAARLFHLSPRTLQRRLSVQRTSFQAESASARLTIAESLMLTTTMNLTAIALELGYSSLQHFIVHFRRVYGETPRRWLEQQHSNPRRLSRRQSSG